MIICCSHSPQILHFDLLLQHPTPFKIGFINSSSQERGICQRWLQDYNVSKARIMAIKKLKDVEMEFRRQVSYS